MDIFCPDIQRLIYSFNLPDEKKVEANMEQVMYQLRYIIWAVDNVYYIGLGVCKKTKLQKIFEHIDIHTSGFKYMKEEGGKIEIDTRRG